MMVWPISLRLLAEGKKMVEGGSNLDQIIIIIALITGPVE